MMLALLLFATCVAACLSCESISSIDERDNSIRRQMFDIPSAYDFYDSKCCDNIGDEAFLNPCPQSPECYSADNCNKCCQGGVSSLKLRWHGKCGGEFTLNTDKLDCETGIKNDIVKSRPMFVDCRCYDGYLMTVNEETRSNMNFDCLHSTTRQIPEHETEADICIVSVDGEGKVDFNSNFASTMSVTWKMNPNSINDGEMTITHFDVSCSRGLPIYPGYAKLSHTCPLEGFIDLPGGLDMFDEISHFDGVPPGDMSWYQFIDGTSSAFWPDSNVVNKFNPTFAVCACGKCKISPLPEPSFVPSLKPFPKRYKGPPRNITNFPSTESTIELNPTLKSNIPTPKVTSIPTSNNPTLYTTSKPKGGKTSPKLSSIPATNPTPDTTSKPTSSPLTSIPTTNPTLYTSPPPKVTNLPTGTTSKSKRGKTVKKPPTSPSKVSTIPTTNPTKYNKSKFKGGQVRAPIFSSHSTITIEPSFKSCDLTTCETYAKKHCFTLNEYGERDVCIWPGGKDRKLQRYHLENELAYHRAKMDELRKMT